MSRDTACGYARKGTAPLTQQIELDALTMRIVELEARLQRTTDLVRYQRFELHNAGLISDGEYAGFVQYEGSVTRLEGYDAMKSECDEARRELSEDRARRRDAQSVDHGIACDRQYIAGLKEGWNLGCCDNRSGLAQAVAARKRAIHDAIDAAREATA